MLRRLPRRHPEPVRVIDRVGEDRNEVSAHLTPRGRGRRVTSVLGAVLALAALTSCSGVSCDELPGLQAEREQRREAYLKLAATDAPPEETGRADEELHAFERRVYDIEQSCAGR